MSGLPADPFQRKDRLSDLVAEGALVLDALASTGDDGGRGLVPALVALEPDDLRVALLVAVIERWRGESAPGPWRQLLRFVRRALGREPTRHKDVSWSA